jgi:hypothetical protein
MDAQQPEDVLFENMLRFAFLHLADEKVLEGGFRPMHPAAFYGAAPVANAIPACRSLYFSGKSSFLTDIIDMFAAMT